MPTKIIAYIKRSKVTTGFLIAYYVLYLCFSYSIFKFGESGKTEVECGPPLSLVGMFLLLASYSATFAGLFGTEEDIQNKKDYRIALIFVLIPLFVSFLSIYGPAYIAQLKKLGLI